MGHNGRMRASRTPWLAAGVVAGISGLAVSHAVAMVLLVRETPVAAVAQRIIEITPGVWVERLIRVVGRLDKPILVLGILVVVVAASALAGARARDGWWRGALVFALLAGLGALAVATAPGADASDLLPVGAGLLVWWGALAWLSRILRREVAAGGRRELVIGSALVLGVSAAAAVVGQVVGRTPRHVAEVRRLLRIPGVTEPIVPKGVTADLEGMTAWMTPADSFYRIDTLIVSPVIEPVEWSLRLHGLVDRPITLTYQQLIDRGITESWVTLNCVSNEVGGPLIGNAWWSGVRLADLLAEAGVREGADAVLQTSEDGWTCSTPLEALTDDRGAMLAVAMNGEPLPVDHGFPVRTIVPGLYGFVSACKWVVDLEVTRFADVSAYWTERGWAEQAPCKIASRIDVPRDGETVDAGSVRMGGLAWHQHVGVSGVQVAVDGGAWQDATLARDASVDTWVQWTATVFVSPGEHQLRVRAIDSDGVPQTGVRRDVVPDGATGWHTVVFEAKEA